VAGGSGQRLLGAVIDRLLPDRDAAPACGSGGDEGQGRIGQIGRVPTRLTAARRRCGLRSSARPGSGPGSMPSPGPVQSPDEPRSRTPPGTSRLGARRAGPRTARRGVDGSQPPYHLAGRGHRATCALRCAAAEERAEPAALEHPGATTAGDQHLNRAHAPPPTARSTHPDRDTRPRRCRGRTTPPDESTGLGAVPQRGRVTARSRGPRHEQRLHPAHPPRTPWQHPIAQPPPSGLPARTETRAGLRLSFALLGSKVADLGS